MNETTKPISRKAAKGAKDFNKGEKPRDNRNENWLFLASSAA